MQGAGWSPITHPFATLTAKRTWPIPFDLHVLSTPPAFVLSQNRTLHRKTRKTRNPRSRRKALQTSIDSRAIPRANRTEEPPRMERGDLAFKKGYINSTINALEFSNHHAGLRSPPAMPAAP